MSFIPGTFKVKAGASLGRPKPAVGLYDFAVDGGVSGDIVLRGDTIPNGAIVVDALLQVDTVPTSAGAATIAVKVQGAADVQAAVAISGAPWSTTGAKRASAVTATAAPITTTAVRTPTITVGTADLTAGKLRVVVWYVELG